MITPVDEDAADSVRVCSPENKAPLRPSITSQSDKRQIVINAGSNAGIMAAKVVLTFLFAPVFVHGLGDTRYGIWMFIGSIATYLFLAEFGLKNAVIRYVARYDGLRNNVGINRAVNTSLVLLTCLGRSFSRSQRWLPTFGDSRRTFPQNF